MSLRFLNWENKLASDGNGNGSDAMIARSTASSQAAFPLDMWVIRGLRRLYFKGRAVNLEELLLFAAEHFGPHAGYAQQYLFHYWRAHKRATEKKAQR